MPDPSPKARLPCSRAVEPPGLADGTWRDAFTGEEIEGGRVVERAAPIREVPVWVRDGDWQRMRTVFGH